MKRKRDPTREVAAAAAVDLTPLVDVTFQLLVFLLVVNDISAKQVEDIELPVAQQATEIRPGDATFVVNVLAPAGSPVNSALHVRVNGHDVALADLRSALRAVADLHRPPTEPGAETRAAVQIRADRAAPWRHVQLVMQECARQDVRIRRIQFGVRSTHAAPTTSPLALDEQRPAKEAQQR